MIDTTAGEGLFVIVVLYHPDDAAIDHLQHLVGWGYRVIAVVNAIDVRQHVRLQDFERITLIENASNRGLAYGLNQGIAAGLSSGADHVMLLDQDTRLEPELGRELVRAAIKFEQGGGLLGCIGPVPVDRKRPLATTTLRDRAPHGADVMLVPTVITSGMIIPRSAILRVGGMWNELFIDHIDHEWCFRAKAAGLAVLLALNLLIAHDIGDAGFSFFGAYKPVHRSPVRHYHIVRNTLWLAQRSFIPRQWRVREVLKLLVRIPAYTAFSADRRATVRSIVQAMRAGFHPDKAATYES